MVGRIQAAELRQGALGPTPLYLDAPAVLHVTAADQVSRKMKYLMAKLATVQEIRAQGKVKTENIDESCHPSGILTKRCRGSRGRGLCLSGGAS